VTVTSQVLLPSPTIDADETSISRAMEEYKNHVYLLRSGAIAVPSYAKAVLGDRVAAGAILSG
jgi:hypothetical protein